MEGKGIWTLFFGSEECFSQQGNDGMIELEFLGDSLDISE